MYVISREHHNSGHRNIIVMTQHTLDEHIRFTTVIEKSRHVSILSSVKNVSGRILQQVVFVTKFWHYITKSLLYNRNGWRLWMRNTGEEAWYYCMVSGAWRPRKLTKKSSQVVCHELNVNIPSFSILPNSIIIDDSSIGRVFNCENY